MDIDAWPIVISFLRKERHGMTRKTSVEINEELLEATRKVLATVTIKETIEAAFQEVLRGEARREEVEALRTMSGMDLADPEVMSKAWRA